MHNFIIQISIVVSLGVIIYLLARVLPRVETSEQDIATSRTTNKLDRLIKKIPLAKIDSALNSFFEKALRKFKILILKVDNLVNRYINKLRKQNRADAPLPLVHKEKKGDEGADGQN